MAEEKKLQDELLQDELLQDELLQDELMSDEELEEVAGGSFEEVAGGSCYEETARDSRFLNSLNGSCGRYTTRMIKCLHATGYYMNESYWNYPVYH